MTVHLVDELDHSTGILVHLSAAERRALMRVGDRLGVEWRSDDAARVYSRGYVGSVSLSANTTIQVVTKVPIANILELASLAYRSIRIPKPSGEAFFEEGQPLDWLALLITTEIEALVRHGLRQGYVGVEDVLPYVRGRIKFDAMAAISRPGFLQCEFADFLPDTVENRLLRSCVELLSTERLLPGLRGRLQRLSHAFQSVPLVRPTLSLVRACRITRLNQVYRPSVELCSLLVAELGVASSTGTTRAPSFFFPMAMVFQEGITELLRRTFPHVSRQSGRTYISEPGPPPRTFSFAADILIGSPPVLVVDTKYAACETRNQYGGMSFRNDNVYQAAFYGQSFGCPALLVYPRLDRDISAGFDLNGNFVEILTVDLALPGLTGIAPLLELIDRRMNAASAAQA